MVRFGLVACFAGEIGSGKTSVTTTLARCLGWRRVGFGDYLRQEVVRRGGNPQARRELQDLGQSLVHSDPVSLCRGVLEMAPFCPGQSLLVDGIRHAVVYHALMDVVRPSRTCLFYLYANERVRRVRATERGEDAPGPLGAHPVEAEITATVAGIADVVVDADRSLASVIRRCVDGLRDQRVDARLLAACTEFAEGI